jgi:Flp pilus assembly protein TadD
MENCKKSLNIDLLQKLDNIYKDDKIKLKLAQAYYKLEKYTDSLNTLNKIKDKSCSFYILISKNYVMLDQWKNLKDSVSLLNNCQNKEKNLILAVYYIQNNNILKAETLILNNMDYISKNYEKDKFYKKLVYIYAEKLISQGNYKNLLQVLSKLAETYKEDCNINSWTLIAKVRLGMVNNIDKDYEKIKECKTDWSIIAKNIYEDFLVERRLNNSKKL